MGFKRWDVVKIPFPAEAGTVDYRPALVIVAGDIQRLHGLVWVLMITSAGNKGWPGDVEITDTIAAGLGVPSVVRSAKVMTVEAKTAELLGALVGDFAPEPAMFWARREAMSTLCRLVAPMIPHVAEEVNAKLNPGAKLVAEKAWPEADAALLVRDEVTIGVQVNGKLRGTITVPAGAAADLALPVARDAVQAALAGLTVVKEIFVPDRIVNFVAKA